MNCLPATTEEAKRLAEVIGVIAKLAHQKEAKFIFQNCCGKSIKKTLIPKIKNVESSAPTIAFVNEDLYHLSFYGYQCNVCFYNRKLQEYRIYLDLHNIYEDLRKAVGDDSMSFTFDELPQTYLKTHSPSPPSPYRWFEFQFTNGDPHWSAQ